MSDLKDAENCQVDPNNTASGQESRARAPVSETQNTRSRGNENQDGKCTRPHEEVTVRSAIKTNRACTCKRKDEMTGLNDVDNFQVDPHNKVRRQEIRASTPVSETQNTRTRGHENQDGKSTQPREEFTSRSGITNPCRLIFGGLCIIVISAALFINCSVRSARDAKKTLWNQHTKVDPDTQKRFVACLQKQQRSSLLQSSLCSQGARNTKSMHSCPHAMQTDEAYLPTQGCASDTHSSVLDYEGNLPTNYRFQSDEHHLPIQGRACDVKSSFSDDETHSHARGCPNQMQPCFQADESRLTTQEEPLCLVFHEVPTASPILDLPPLEDRPSSCPVPVSSSRRNICPRAKHKTR